MQPRANCLPSQQCHKCARTKRRGWTSKYLGSDNRHDAPHLPFARLEATKAMVLINTEGVHVLRSALCLRICALSRQTKSS